MNLSDYETRSRPLLPEWEVPDGGNERTLARYKVSTNLFAFLVAALYRFEVEELTAYCERRYEKLDTTGRTRSYRSSGEEPEDGSPYFFALSKIRSRGLGIDWRGWANPSGILFYVSLQWHYEKVDVMIDPWLFPRTGSAAHKDVTDNRYSTDRGPGICDDTSRAGIWAYALSMRNSFADVEIVPQDPLKWVKR